ncbi:hypothetical protein EV189_2627 [Motilibacter rhizosphaerae]|uniref:PT repeat-containing protein n=1 Tax=Motilibacter rhizosphaerae TaxID=598652 RepID=A0A4Q7NPT8_9ACTN|nr:hypothetical protein [Motilibacter rhizosphaerae]RZS87203.1 hypothetical protein EV189_2627 [Motilibacter rhizosphaerae]
MLSTTRARSVLAAGAVVLGGSLVLTACGGSGGSSGSSGTASAAAPAPAASGAPRSGGFRQDPQMAAEFTKIRQCLQAAGIPVPTPSARPGYTPGASPRPRFTPGATPRPGFTPGARGGRPGGFGGGGLGRITQDPQAQAAIKACGLTLPTFAPRPAASGAAGG